MTTTHAETVLAQFDGGEGGTRLVTAVEATDPTAVFLTDEGLAVLYAPDKRSPSEPYRDLDGIRYSAQHLGTLRAVDFGGEGGIG